jgi:chemotaxis protein methyltransferase CheR
MSELEHMALLREAHPLDGFGDLRDIAYREAGLVLSEAKAPMIQSRLRHRLRALQMNSLKQYCEFVENEADKAEMDKLISALTTNVSGFFREPHHFDFLEENVYPALREKLSRGKTIRIWSAGCSTGQEPYSLVIDLLEKVGCHSARLCKVLATDIDVAVLSQAQEGIYSESQISGLPHMLKDKYTTDLQKGSDRFFQICDDVRSRIVFRRLNLHSHWPMKQKFDFIFCRNVIIYFDTETQDRLWPRFHDILCDGGVICIGHSERINSELFVNAGSTTYKKA